jgi:hypothetical protein
MEDQNFDREAIRAMMEKATESLLGFPVKIVLRDPITEGNLGHVYLDSGGKNRIDLRPGLSLEKMYLVWLHEVGHIFNGDLSDSEPLPYDKIPSKSLPLLEDLEAYHAHPEEVAANSFADGVDHFAEYKALDLYVNVGIESRLRVLMDTRLSHE